MYVNYYDREIKQDYENSTVVKYTLPEDNKTIFSSEYKLHMKKSSCDKYNIIKILRYKWSG